MGSVKLVGERGPELFLPGRVQTLRNLAESKGYTFDKNNTTSSEYDLTVWRCDFCSSVNHPDDDNYHGGKCPHCGGARGALSDG